MAISYLEHVAEQTDHTLVQIIRDGKDARLDLPEECRDVLVVKGESPAQESIQDHSAGPDVHLGTSVELPRDHLQDKGIVWFQSDSQRLGKCFLTSGAA